MNVEPRMFCHSGRNLEVRATQTATGWEVRVFEGDQRVTRVFYTVSYETQIDADIQGADLLDALMCLAQEDIEVNRVPLVSLGWPQEGG